MEILPATGMKGLHEGKKSASKWTAAENKVFENALAMYDEDTPDRWHKVAALIPGKTVNDVIKQYEELEADVSSIEAGLVPIPGYDIAPFTLEWVNGCGRDGYRRSHVIGGKRAALAGPQEQGKKKGVPWTEEEHKLFLMGLKKYGKGDWRNISRNFVITRTPTQVASHAQKFFIRQLSGGKDKRRASIHDITTVSLDEDTQKAPSSTWSNRLIKPPQTPGSLLWKQMGNQATRSGFNLADVNAFMPNSSFRLHSLGQSLQSYGDQNMAFAIKSSDCYSHK